MRFRNVRRDTRTHVNERNITQTRENPRNTHVSSRALSWIYVIAHEVTPKHVE